MRLLGSFFRLFLPIIFIFSCFVVALCEVHEEKTMYGLCQLLTASGNFLLKYGKRFFIWKV